MALNLAGCSEKLSTYYTYVTYDTYYTYTTFNAMMSAFESECIDHYALQTPISTITIIRLLYLSISIYVSITQITV